MKLKIKNYDRIKGTYEKLHIEDVIETGEQYVFYCRRRGRPSYEIVLSRDGYKDAEGDWIYHFYNGRNKTQSVTPAWFEQMGNAVSAIISEFDTQYGL